MIQTFSISDYPTRDASFPSLSPTAGAAVAMTGADQQEDEYDDGYDSDAYMHSYVLRLSIHVFILSHIAT